MKIVAFGPAKYSFKYYISFERVRPKCLLARPLADFGPVGHRLDPPVDDGPNQAWCGAGSVLGPDFGEILTPLVVANDQL